MALKYSMLNATFSACAFIASLLMVSATVPSQAAESRQGEWATVTNPRYGYSIRYPVDLLTQIRTPSGQDGRVMQSADGRVKLLVATFENTENVSLETYRQFLLSDIYVNAKIDYAPQRGRWFVLSGVRGDETFYERVTFSCEGQLINSWAMLYPTAEHHHYDRVVEAIARTYTAGSGANGDCASFEAAGGRVDPPRTP